MSILSFSRQRTTAGLAAVLLAAGTMARDADPRATLAALARDDAMVAAAGYRLATASRPLCRPGYASGLSLHSLDQYGPAFRPAARVLFRLGDRSAVAAVVPGSPAARAGLARGAELLAGDGVSIPGAAPRPDAPASFATVGRAIEVLDEALADGSARLTVRDAAGERSVMLTGTPACRVRFEVVPVARQNATAGDHIVQITDALVRFAADEDELAAILAHELAHVVVRHEARLGGGRRARAAVRATEIEADRLSPYLLARAGYDPAAAVRYWQRSGRERGDRLFPSGTHPRWRERVALITRELPTIVNARAAGHEPAIPPDLVRWIAR